jgi:hypothetical protein
LPIIQIVPEWEKYDFRASFVNKEITFSEIQAEISRDCPVEIGFRWSNGGGHAVLATGWDIIDGVPNVLIYDPWKGSLTTVYDKVLSAYGQGTWNWTWKSITKVI